MERKKSTSCVPRPSKQTISKLPIHLWFTSRRRLVGGPSSAGRRVTAAGGGASAVNVSHVDRYLLENFPSLYGGRSRSDANADGHEDKHNGGHDYDDICCRYYITRPDEVSPRLTLPSPRAVRASERFSVPTSSASSLAEEARLLAVAAECGGEAVVRFSSEPYEEFRRSMEEMVEAQGPGRRPDWEFMQRLFFSYLELNERSVHGDIVRAFTELTSSIRCATRSGRRT